MLALLISMQRFKSNKFYQNIPKISCFSKKYKFFCAEGSAPRPPCLLRQLGVSPPDLRAFCSSWEFRPQAPKTSPTLRISGYVTGVIIAVLFFFCKVILRLAGAYGFPQAALSLNKFAHPWTKSYFCK